MRGSHHLLVCFGHDKIVGDDLYDGISGGSVSDLLLQPVEIPYLVIANCPVIQRIVLNGLGGQPGDQLQAVEMINGKIIARFRLHIEITEIDNRPFGYLKLYIPVTRFPFARVDVFLFKINTRFVGGGDNKAAHHEGKNSNNGC
ncbi:hypothetical protein SDC9_171666 [bioreactor metagenome]|uniref:Uncharacterized protein n=1 Tax=bioreactor metagenome TaxID=1076179 RepID=A0A645GBJ9_9ZZZZ